jgi:hypothetical protein
MFSKLGQLGAKLKELLDTHRFEQTIARNDPAGKAVLPQPRSEKQLPLS